MVRLPVEYQEVEYLESTGTQYIDTGYVPVEDTWVDAEYGFSDTYSGEQVMLGASSVNYTYNNTTGLTVQLYNRNKWYCGCGGSVFGGVLTGIGKELYIKHRVILTKSLLTVDGNEQGNPGRATFDPSQPCYLYAINAYGIGAQRLSKTLRLYSVKLYENENIMRDFIPCYRKSDNEPGMYDTVSGTFFTNAGTGTFIVGNDVSWDTASLIERRRQILLNTPHLTTESANPLTFQTDISANLKDCKVYFEPVQEGTGDPSPDNVRPISGWDGVTVTRCGKCIYDGLSIATLTSGGVARTIYEDDHGRYVFIDPGNTYYPFPDGMIKENTRYTFILSTYVNINIAYLRIQYSDGATEFISVNSGTNTVAFTTKAGKTLRGINCIRRSATRKLYIDESGLFEDVLTANEYEPYTGTSLTIPFPQTIYGGYVDLVKGEVVEEWKFITLNGDENWSFSSSWSNDSVYCVYDNNSYNDALFSDYNGIYTMCDQLISGSRNACYSGALKTLECISFSGISTAPKLTIKLSKSRVSSVDDVKAYLVEHTPMVAYKLATPITHQLTPQTIKTLKGINNIWSDANGNVEIKYWGH